MVKIVKIISVDVGLEANNCCINRVPPNVVDVDVAPLVDIVGNRTTAAYLDSNI